MFGDSFFKRVENKTNVDKNTILSLAKKIQDGNMKDEKTLREVVSEISNLTGREVSKEKEDKIINTIINACTYSCIFIKSVSSPIISGTHTLKSVIISFSTL